MERRTPRRCRFAACGVVLLLLPSCLTCGMWGHDYLTDEALPTGPAAVELVRRESHYQEGVIAVNATMGFPGLPALALHGTDGAPSWWLRPVRGDDVALHLLCRRHVLAPTHATVTAVRELHDREVVRAAAELVLVGAGADAGLGQEVSVSALTAQARTVLAEPRRNAFVFAADPWLFLPVVLRSCRQGLSSAQLAKWLEVPDAALAIESFVFVGADGLPRFEPGMQVPAEANDDQQPLASRLELLASVALVLRLRCADAERFVRLCPDALWLRGACEPGEGGLRHRSLWQLEAAAVAAAPPGEATIPCHLVRTDAVYRVLKDAPVDLWVKIALTPVTLALDFTVLLPFTLLRGSLRDDDDDERASARRR